MVGTGSPADARPRMASMGHPPAPEMFHAQVWNGEGHLIASFEDESGMIHASCTCTLDAVETDGYEPTAEDRIITARIDEVETWADEHRASVGLAPQDFVPNLIEVLKWGQRNHAITDMPDDEFAELMREVEELEADA